MKKKQRARKKRAPKELHAGGENFARAVSLITSTEAPFMEALGEITSKIAPPTEHAAKELLRYYCRKKKKDGAPVPTEERFKLACEIEQFVAAHRPKTTPQQEQSLPSTSAERELTAHAPRFQAALKIAAKAPRKFGQVLTEVQDLYGSISKGAKKQLQSEWKKAVTEKITLETTEQCAPLSTEELRSLQKELPTSGFQNQLRRRLINAQLRERQGKLP